MEFQKSPWDLVDEIAAEAGGNKEARRKWRERGGVPPKWHVYFIQKFADKGIIVGLDFFERLAVSAGVSERVLRPAMDLSAKLDDSIRQYTDIKQVLK